MVRLTPKLVRSKAHGTNEENHLAGPRQTEQYYVSNALRHHVNASIVALDERRMRTVWAARRIISPLELFFVLTADRDPVACIRNTTNELENVGILPAKHSTDA